MIIKAKALSTEFELQLPDEKEIVAWRSANLIVIIDKIKTVVIEIETKINELSKVQTK